MDQPIKVFQDAVKRIADQWVGDGLPSREGLDKAAHELVRIRERYFLSGIWRTQPCMVTATLDDGLGQGLAIIEKFSDVIGIRLIRLGLMQTPEEVIDACQQHQPDFLGMTILQFDTEEDLLFIGKRLPRHTRIIAGGPVFNGNSGFAERTGIHFAAKNVADFLLFMLTLATENGR